jgi:hypothetical protein
MTTLNDAVFVAYPNAVTVSSGGTFATTTAHDANGNVVALDEVVVQAYIDAHAYIEKRQKEYPPMTDYLDGIAKGDQAQIDKYIADCQAVKAKYPKG